MLHAFLCGDLSSQRSFLPEDTVFLTDPGQLSGKRVLFVISLGAHGVNHAAYDLLHYLRTHPSCMAGSVGGVWVDGEGDLYTKSLGRDIVLSASLAGCAFPGRCLVEGTGSLRNFAVQAKNGNCSLEEAYRRSVGDLVRRILTFAPPKREKPRLAVLHASNHRTSNTAALWKSIRERLGDRFEITEVGLRNGTLVDCSGCPYTMCLHFGEQGGCFYGGVMVEEVYPAIRASDAVVLLCPNYNDALSANLTAFINRLTALYRTLSFQDKAVFALVVSGYSGSDIVASQVVSALSMNKGFWLPPEFCLLETANDPGTAIALQGIGERLDRFAENLEKQLRR
ncbi:MAG: NAD(P)H-dependent oxidoreductase [Oscillibacter sp.]|nr:NAD(P)H-dependent oxidoreductase [Oscillibacter sp.]